MERVLVLYDSECGICNRLVDWLIDRDHGQRLTFAGLQGTTAAGLRQRHPLIPTHTDTLILVRGTQPDEQIRLRTQAVLGVFALLPWPWKVLGPLRFLPAMLLDPPYRLVAALRGRLPAPRARDPQRTNSGGERFLP